MAGTGIYGELLKAQLENLSSDPGSTSVGRVYWNTTTQSPRVYTSSGWDDLGSAGSSSGRNYLSDWFDSYKVESVGTSAATSTGNRTVAGNTDPTKWVTSDLTNLTFARSADTTLRQSYNYLINSGDANADFVESPLFTLDGVDLGKPITVSFDCAGVSASDDYQVCAVRYDSSGTYQEVITIAGTASATSPYSARIPTGTTKFQGFFIAGSTATDQYAIRFMKHAVNVDLRIDSLYVGPEKVVQGAGISDWVAFTPSGSNLPSFTTNVGWYRRVGDSMEIAVKWLVSGAGAAATSSINIPNSNTADTSKTNIVGNGSSLGSGYWYAASGTDSIPVSITTDGSSIYIVGQNAGNADTLDGNDFAASDQVSFTATIPIVGWSSNITMADRAVEEFASNYGTTATADDATSFAYGASGSNFANITAAHSKTVRFTTPILSTDKISLEITTDGGVTWVDVSQSAANIYPFAEQNGVTYGMSWWKKNTTDVYVFFGTYCKTAGATFGSAGTAWSTIDADSTYKWRVRKVSGGAAVGYPIGARNIVGDTTGTTVPSGYIGEIKSASSSGAATLTTGQYSDGGCSPITLGPGTWTITASFNVAKGSASAVTTIIYGVGTASGNSSTGMSVASGTIAGEAPASHTPSGDFYRIMSTPAILVTAETSYYPKFYMVGTLSSTTVTSYIKAVRIA